MPASPPSRCITPLLTQRRRCSNRWDLHFNFCCTSMTVGAGRRSFAAARTAGHVYTREPAHAAGATTTIWGTQRDRGEVAGCRCCWACR